MDISKGLILKGTAATAAVATTSTGAYYHEEIGDILSSVFSGEDDEEKTQDGASQPVSGGSKGQQEDVSGEAGSENDGNSGHVSRSGAVNGEKNGKDSLGLPDGWTWPSETANSVKSELSNEQLKKVNFDGKTAEEDLSVSGGVDLTIEKVNENSDFPQGFKFIFNPKNDSDVTITGGSGVSITLKKGMDLEFKIKVTDEGKWSLEKAWNKTTLLEKINLSCSGGSNGTDECSFKQNGTTSVFVTTSNKLISATVTNGSGKIKLEEGQKGYNQGLKFTIEDADINVSGTTKLEKYETYEIKEIEDDGSKKWFFARKNSAVQSINKKIKPLGLPADCKFNEGESKKICENLDESKLKGISFKGFGTNSGDLKVEGSVSGMKLEMERVSVGDRFPSDLIFTFKDFTADTITIKKESGEGNSIVLKNGTNPEFKLNSTNNKLERVWTANELGKKVGLDCPTSGSKKECSFNGSLRVYEEDGKKTTAATVSGTDKKLEFSENEKDHNQGFKFTVKNADIDLTLDGGDNSGISTLTKTNTSYEIKYMDDGWYLHKITAS